MELLTQILVWLRDNWETLRYISIIVSTIFIFLIVFLNFKLNLVREKMEHWIDVVSQANISRRHSLRAWRKIQKRIKTRSSYQMKLAVVESDRLLNEILKLAGYRGSNLEERLEEITPAELSNVHELRQAHKIRDRILSEPDFELSVGEAEVAINIYKKAFLELGLIEED